MEVNNKYIRFDWAVKRMLRDKANFAVLEGLITVLTGEVVKIEELLESEGNQESASDKFNRVDIKAKNVKGEIIIVEVQLTRQLYFLQRMLYGVSKAITEHIDIGQKYDEVKKVYSINILYFHDLACKNSYQSFQNGEVGLVAQHSLHCPVKTYVFVVHFHKRMYLFLRRQNYKENLEPPNVWRNFYPFVYT